MIKEKNLQHNKQTTISQENNMFLAKNCRKTQKPGHKKQILFSYICLSTVAAEGGLHNFQDIKIHEL